MEQNSVLDRTVEEIRDWIEDEGSEALPRWTLEALAHLAIHHIAMWTHSPASYTFEDLAELGEWHASEGLALRIRHEF